MDMPGYSTVEIMTKMVLIAVRLCGDIDDDGSYMEDDYGEEGIDTGTVDMSNMENDIGDFIGDAERTPTIPESKDFEE